MGTSRIPLIPIAILLIIIITTCILVIPTFIPIPEIKDISSRVTQSLDLQTEKQVITPVSTQVIPSQPHSTQIPVPEIAVSVSQTQSPDPCTGTLHTSTLWADNKSKSYSLTDTISHNRCIPKETTSAMPDDGKNWTAVFIQQVDPADPEHSSFALYPGGISLYEQVIATYEPVMGTTDITSSKLVIPSRDIFYPVLNSVCNDGHGYCTASFGYVNMANDTVFIPVGPDNYVTPSGDYQGQPTEFLPGYHPDAFIITFPAWSTSRMWGLHTKTAVAIPPDRMRVGVTSSLPDGYAPLTVTFTSDVSGGTITDPLSYQWNFGDNETSDEENPTHTYYTPKEYWPSLTVSNRCGFTTAITRVIVDKADFSWEPVMNRSYQYRFTDLSDGDAGSWLWVFGTPDEFSNEQNPVYTFSGPGRYTVTMTVTRPGTSRTVLHQIPVTS